MRCGSSVMPIWWRRKATIGAKSFSDQGSGSADGGGGSMPDVATLDSLTVQRRQGRKDSVHIQYEQECVVVTDQPAHEGGCLPEAELG